MAANAARTPIFLWCCMLCVGAFSGLMIISLMHRPARRIAVAAEAAAVVSIVALFNTAGGELSADIYLTALAILRYDLWMVFTGSILGLILLYYFSSPDTMTFMFYLGVSIMGFMFGSIMGIYPGWLPSLAPQTMAWIMASCLSALRQRSCRTNHRQPLYNLTEGQDTPAILATLCLKILRVCCLAV